MKGLIKPRISYEEEIKNAERIAEALNMAQLAHMNQKRKGSSLPYIVHPMEVWTILRNNFCSVNVQIAGILHDTIEDAGLPPELIEKKFGKEVLALVVNETEDKTKTWKERKLHTVERLRNSPIEVKQVACADKLSNCRAQYYDFMMIGDTLWERFNRGYEDQSWYYKNIVESLSALEGMEMYTELKSMVNKVYG